MLDLASFEVAVQEMGDDGGLSARTDFDDLVGEVHTC